MRLIDAEPLLKAVKENKELYERERLYLEGLLLNAPTVEAKTTADCIIAYGDGYEAARRLTERPQGEWIYERPNGKTYSDFVYCSHCQKPNGFYKTNFCPNCGAQMVGGSK